MLNLFGGGKANVEVRLERTRYQPGEMIPVQVTVSGEKDLTIREGRVTLICCEEQEVRYEERRRDADGRWSTHDTRQWQKSEFEVGKHVFLGEGTVRGGSMETYACNFAIPPDALPTCADGKIVRVRWLVKATLDRKMAGDIEDQAEVLVFTTPRGIPATGPFGLSNQPEEAELSLALPTLEWALGETIEGQLLVRPERSFGVSEVRIELVRVEQVHDGPSSAGNRGFSNRRTVGNEAQHVEKVRVVGRLNLERGREEAFPFRIAIPNGPVSAQLHGASMTWILKGILARPLRSDTRVEQEIAVYGAWA